MKTSTHYAWVRNGDGYALLILLILMALSTAAVAGSLRVSSSNVRTTMATAIRAQTYFTGESGVHEALSWLRNNSQSLTSPFSKTNFNNLFTRTAPSVGDNDTGSLTVPTKIKLKNTNSSAILSTNDDLATSAFPDTTHIVTNSAFSPTAQFTSNNVGSELVRVTLVDAVPLDPAQDSPPQATSNTDYYPIYRIDAMSSTDRGAHVLGYVTGSLYYVDIIGFYGENFVNVSQDCTSTTFTGSAPGTTNAKCPVGSKGTITVANNAEIYGTARTTGSIVTAGKVCADYPSCAQQGTKCSGASCTVPNMPTFQAWDVYCPAGTSLGNYTVAASQNKILVTPGCYDTVTINNKGSLTLVTTTSPYYFKTLTVSGGNPLTQLKVNPSPSSANVQLYVQTITGNIINGNQTVNASARPSQLRFYYLGNADLTVNGNSPVSMAMVAPYANVTLSGNSNYNGGVLARGLTMTGSGNVVYDESLGGTSLTDVTYKLRELEEYYR